tara:strand:- start:274 stop:837 length:564 start_codon:yes stop_codon:yes gene_type:complete
MKEYKKRYKDEDYHKKYYEKNKEAFKEYQKNNRERIKENDRKNYWLNKENRIKSVRKWQQKVKDDPYRKFKNRIKASMRYHIKKNGESTFNLLNYTKEEFLNRMKETLPEEYTWENFLKNTKAFHIDHIIPQKFYLNEEEYIVKCWNLRNLRLLPAKENLSRADEIDIKLVKKYDIEDLLPFSSNPV